MANSLQEQLKQSGLIDNKKAKQIAKEKHKQHKLDRNRKQPSVNEQALLLQKEQAEKVAKDRALNQTKNEKQQRRAIAAQIKQLIENNAVEASGDQTFNFTDGKRVKNIYVEKAQAERLTRGILSIVKLGDKYVMVPSKVAWKIAERDASRIVFRVDSDPTITSDDDPYTDYQVPDDLMW